MDAEPTRTDQETDLSNESGARAVIRDRRPALRPVLPRQTQTWIMLGLAGLILVVILITGRPEPSPIVSMPPAATQSVTVQPERVRSLQQRLAEQETRAREAQATPSIIPEVTVARPVATPAPVDPVVDEGRRREEQSLFADNVAFSRRSSGAVQTATATAPSMAMPWLFPPPSVPSPVGASASAAPTSESQIHDGDSRSMVTRHEPASVTETRADVKDVSRRLTLLEGTVIESVLVNRLDGAFQGPVQCLVTTPVYSQDRQLVVIPAGARVLGSAAPVQAWGDRRLAVRFHRLVMPDGTTHTLDSFTGLNHVGETGLSDQVDRHYLQVFGASLAIGAIAGLAQVGSRGGFDMSATDSSRQGASASLATSTARVLDRYLNVLPTITIREGHRIKIVLTSDLHLPSYPRTIAAGSPPPAVLTPFTAGGSR